MIICGTAYSLVIDVGDLMAGCIVLAAAACGWLTIADRLPCIDTRRSPDCIYVVANAMPCTARYRHWSWQITPAVTPTTSLHPSLCRSSLAVMRRRRYGNGLSQSPQPSDGPCPRRLVISRRSRALSTVSYTHLTLPTILRV